MKDLGGVLTSQKIQTAALNAEANRASNVATAAVVAEPTAVGNLKANFSLYQELCVQPAYLGTVTGTKVPRNRSEVVAMPSFAGVITYAYDVAVTSYTRQHEAVDSFVTLSATAFDGLVDSTSWPKRVVAPKTPCMAALEDETPLNATYFSPESDAIPFTSIELSSGTLSIAASVLAYNLSSYVRSSFFFLDTNRFGDVALTAREYCRAAIFASMDENLAQSLQALKRLFDNGNGPCRTFTYYEECVAAYPGEFNTSVAGLTAALVEFSRKNESCNAPGEAISQHRYLDTTLFPCGSTERSVECTYGDPRVADSLVASIIDANADLNNNALEEQVLAMALGVDEILDAIKPGQGRASEFPYLNNLPIQNVALNITNTPASQLIFGAWRGSAEALSESDAAVSLEWPSGVGVLLLEDRAAAARILTDDVQNNLVPEVGGDACDATVDLLTLLFLALAAFYGAVGGVEGACDAIDVRLRRRRHEGEAAEAPVRAAAVGPKPAAVAAVSPTGSRHRSDGRGSAFDSRAAPVDGNVKVKSPNSSPFDDEEETKAPAPSSRFDRGGNAGGAVAAAAAAARSVSPPADMEAPNVELLAEADDDGDGPQKLYGSERLGHFGCLDSESGVVSLVHPFCNYTAWLLVLSFATFWAPFTALVVQMRLEIAARDYSQEITGLFIREYSGSGADSFNSYALVSAVSLTTACDGNEAAWAIALVILTAFAAVLMQWQAMAVLVRAVLWHWPFNLVAKVTCRGRVPYSASRIDEELRDAFPKWAGS